MGLHRDVDNRTQYLGYTRMNIEPRSFSSPGQSSTVVSELIKAHLAAEARKQTLRRAVKGARFCAVALDDGITGVANISPDACGKPSPEALRTLPEPGSPAGDALFLLGSPGGSAAGLATANALANRSIRDGGLWDETRIGGNLLEVLDLRPEDHVGMVGHFFPLEEPIRSRVERLSIFERGPRLATGLLSEDHAPEVLSRCSIAIITATTLINGTCDALLEAATPCRETVLLGPSTPLLPEVFLSAAGRVTLLSGMVVTDPEALLSVIARGGGTRDFKGCMAKVNVRVRPGR